MATAGLLATIDLYVMEKDQLTTQVSDILMDITKVTKISSDITIEESKKKQAINDKAQEDSTYADSTEYEVDKDEITAEFETKLAAINEWEKQLEMKKSNLETQLQAISAFEQSFETVLKENLKKDFKYGGSGGS